MSSDTVRKFEPYSMSRVYQQSSKELFTVVSTFSGGGGSSTGYQLGGGKILMVNEFIDSGVDTYRSNYPNTPIEHIEIRQITRRKKKGVLEMFSRNGIQKGEYDILDGSPPCSTFSTSGKGKQCTLRMISTTRRNVPSMSRPLLCLTFQRKCANRPPDRNSFMRCTPQTGRRWRLCQTGAWPLFWRASMITAPWLCTETSAVISVITAGRSAAVMTNPDLSHHKCCFDAVACF